MSEKGRQWIIFSMRWKKSTGTRWVKFLDVHLHLVLEIPGEVGPPGIVSSMEWWAIHREWRSFTRIQRSLTASWTCHCAQEDEDCTRPESMIRQRLGHSVRHDTTGGDVYLRCLPLSFPARSSWKDTWRLVLGCFSKKSLRNNFYLVASLWLVYATVLVTSKTTILRFQTNEKELSWSQAVREVKDPCERSKIFFFSKYNGPADIYNYLK